MPLLRVLATLDSPLVMADDLHFDGLLASAHPLCRAHPLGVETQRHALVVPPLPLYRIDVHAHRVACASVADFPDDARLMTADHVKRRDGVDLEALARPIHLGLGPGKNRWTRYTSVVAAWVGWWCIGDRREVTRLVRRITHVGQLRASGYGAVRTWTITASETDDPIRVWVHRGRAQRHLPREVCAAAQAVETAALEPPYWHPDRQAPDVARAGSRVALLSSYAEHLTRAADRSFAIARALRKKQTRDARRAGPYPGGAPAGG